MEKITAMDTNLSVLENNIEVKIEGNHLLIKIDPSRNFGKSKSGKTQIVASSRGNQPIHLSGDRVLYLGLNLYEREG